MAAKPHIFVDNQLSPNLASWIARSFATRCTHISQVRPRIYTDADLVRVATVPGGIVLSKDEDFTKLLRTRRSPPDLIWLRCGNRSDQQLKAILRAQLGPALDLIKYGEHIVEIRDPDMHTARRR